MMEMTDRAHRRLESYLEEVRLALAARPGLEVDDVLRGLREHVDAELAAHGHQPGEPVTAAELEDVLERLGPPTSLAEAAEAGPAAPPGSRLPSLVALGLLLAGALLFAGGMALPVAFLLVAAGFVLGRVALGSPASGPAGTTSDRLLRLVLIGAAAALVVAILVAPAVLVWSQAQIGGVLDAARNPGAPQVPGTRPASYWTYVAGVGALATGLWWLLAGSAAVRWTAAVRRLLGPFPFRFEARHGRVLAGAGLALAAAGLLMALL
jgi:hypothetical protein